MAKIILSADCACDIGPQLQKEYDVQFFYFNIIIGGNSYLDGKEIQPEDIYEHWTRDKLLPKTAAITPEAYFEKFSRWVKEGYEVIHLNMGSWLSSAHQNAMLAAQGLEGVYPIDSCNLSAGIGGQVIRAGEMIRQGIAAPEIAGRITGMRDKFHVNFIMDTLEYMRAGGRCSSVTALGANLLKIKPCIEVNIRERGKLDVGKKYRGSMERVLVQFTKDKLASVKNLDTDFAFVSNSGSPDSDTELVKSILMEAADFKQIYTTKTSCTISSHCGPRTLGILLMDK